MHKGLIVILLATLLQACAAGPGKPGEAPLTQPSAQPSNDYIYRSPPPDVAAALQ